MPMSSFLLTLLLAGVAGLPAAVTHGPQDPPCPSPGEIPCRVGGDLGVVAEAGVSRDGSRTWRSGRFAIDTPLPEGYPAPTPPGALEIKQHQPVRRAVTSLTRGRGGGFWPLFNHIKSRDIAMTSPVEMDYSGLRPGAPQEGGPATMAFLYRRVDQGPLGSDWVVEVVDQPALTVLALGLRGRPDAQATQDAVQEMADWLDAHPDWEVAGDVRELHYNGPMTWPKWSEVQVPIRRAAAPASGAAVLAPLD